MLNITEQMIDFFQYFSFVLGTFLTSLVVHCYPFKFQNEIPENGLQVLATWSGDACWPSGLLSEGGRGVDKFSVVAH